jgi:septal ring factor EnvC (AmiA/AmiB activator)
VVFADRLRGFGRPRLIDHREGVACICGGNGLRPAPAGRRIGAGDPLVSRGGVAEAGLYFTLRVEGRPIDPLRWARAPLRPELAGLAAAKHRGQIPEVS